MYSGKEYNRNTPNKNCYGEYNPFGFTNIYEDTAGCSKILHTCKYEEGEYDIYNYCPKVSPSERNKGLWDMEKKGVQITGEWEYSTKGKGLPSANFHPTVKPISLMARILKLFRTPNPQIILDTFMGSGSTGIACKKLGLNFIGIEKDLEYFKIAEARINERQKDIFEEIEEKRIELFKSQEKMF
jgi:DNA modification methylase